MKSNTFCCIEILYSFPFFEVVFYTMLHVSLINDGAAWLGLPVVQDIRVRYHLGWDRGLILL